MKPGFVAVVVFVVFVLAFVAGRATAPRPRLSRAQTVGLPDKPDVVDADDDDDDVAADGAGAPSGSGAPAPPRVAGAAAGGNAEVGIVSVERTQFLEREVARLQKLVEVQQATTKETEGTAIAFPEGHNAEGDQAKLMDSLQAQMKSHGLKGDITAVDCSEFPCIAHGVIAGINDDALEGVIGDTSKALAGSPYASFNRFVDDKDAAKNKTTFSLSVFPKDLPEAEQENLNKRLRARKNAFVD
jgi:hypothetical protein